MSLDQTLWIWLGIQFRQRYIHIAHRMHILRKYVWLNGPWDLKLIGTYSKLFKKSTPDWLMDGILSDFDDNFILFIKMVFSSSMQQIQTYLVFSILNTKHFLIWAIMVILSGKVRKICFWGFELKSDKNIKYFFSNI